MAKAIVGLCFILGLSAAGCTTRQSPPGIARESLTQAERLQRFVENRPEQPAPITTSGVELSAEEKARVITDPLHIQAQAASRVRASERAATLASRLALGTEDTRRFLAIMADNHNAKLAIIEFRKQHRNLAAAAFRERLHSEVPATVIGRASAAHVHAQVKSLLGTDRYAQFLTLLDSEG